MPFSPLQIANTVLAETLMLTGCSDDACGIQALATLEIGLTDGAMVNASRNLYRLLDRLSKGHEWDGIPLPVWHISHSASHTPRALPYMTNLGKG